jgi:hypothetical protein
VSEFTIEKNVPVTNGRVGPKLSRFPLGDMEVGDSFLIPFVKRVIKERQHNSPKYGFNVKEANQQFAPKKFKKTRTDDGIRVHRVQ